MYICIQLYKYTALYNGLVLYCGTVYFNVPGISINYSPPFYWLKSGYKKFSLAT